MIHPQNYLLEKIIHKGDEFKTLGALHGIHVEDISNVMRQFAEESIIEVLERLGKGESIEIRGKVFKIITRKKTKTK